MSAMKTTLRHFSSFVAALLLSLGMVRAAGSFDTLGGGHTVCPSQTSLRPAGGCTSSCAIPR